MEIEKNLKDAIEKYRKLPIGGKEIVCPYFINIKNARDLRAMVGKGTPEEIVMEANIWAKIKGVDFLTMTENEIKDFLTERGIGIDCSGFVSHVLNYVYNQLTSKNIWRKLVPENKTLMGKLKYYFRPVEQLGAQTLTNSYNSDPIEIKDVRLLDLVRSKAKRKNAHHIMIIIGVKRDLNGNISEIDYAHATPYFEEESGVKTGTIKIKHINLPLEKQDWLEIDKFGVCHTLEGYLMENDDNGIRRLKVLKNIELV